MILYISKYTKKRGEVNYFGLWPNHQYSVSPPITFYFDGSLKKERETLEWIQRWAEEHNIAIPNLARYIEDVERLLPRHL